MLFFLLCLLVPVPETAPEKFHLVYVTAPNCGWCKKMENETLADKQVAARIRDHYIFEKVSGKEAAKYHVNGVPAYILLAPGGREIRRGSGYRPPGEFLKWLDKE